MRVRSIEKILILEIVPDHFKLKEKLKPFNLTGRQEEIAILAIRGLTNREIAKPLFITEVTVRDHLRDIFKDADVSSRGELTAKVLGLNQKKS